MGAELTKIITNVETALAIASWSYRFPTLQGTIKSATDTYCRLFPTYAVGKIILWLTEEELSSFRGIAEAKGFTNYNQYTEDEEE